MYNSFSLARDVDYTLAPHCARSMGVSGSILISPMVHTLTDEQVCDTGFTDMWAPVDQPLGFLGLGDTQVILACTSQWDGHVNCFVHVVEHLVDHLIRVNKKDHAPNCDLGMQQPSDECDPTLWEIPQHPLPKRLKAHLDPTNGKSR